MLKPLSREETIEIINHLGKPFELTFTIVNDNPYLSVKKVITRTKKKFFFFKVRDIRYESIDSSTTLVGAIDVVKQYLKQYERACNEADRVRSEYIDVMIHKVLSDEQTTRQT